MADTRHYCTVNTALRAHVSVAGEKSGGAGLPRQPCRENGHCLRQSFSLTKLTKPYQLRRHCAYCALEFIESFDLLDCEDGFAFSGDNRIDSSVSFSRSRRGLVQIYFHDFSFKVMNAYYIIMKCLSKLIRAPIYCSSHFCILYREIARTRFFLAKPVMSMKLRGRSDRGARARRLRRHDQICVLCNCELPSGNEAITSNM